MPSSVKIPWERRLGRIGEDEISSRLRHFSLPNKYDEDVGIDFYCELLENDSPSIPFYVQAKGTGHFDDNWGASIKRTTIVYWLNQLHPVFLVVYDETVGNCYWMSVEDYRYDLIKKAFETKGETIYLKMDKSHILEKGKSKNDEFIRKVEMDSNSIEQFRGHPLFIGEDYVKRIPSHPRSKIELLRTKESVRAGLYSLSLFYLLQKDLKNAYLLCEFLTRFDRDHYNHFVWFGMINKALGRKQEAKASFEEALKICDRDKKWPRESMKKIGAQIEKEIAHCI
jgi:tetratricopeptide (TPR) repeat protein